MLSELRVRDLGVIQDLTLGFEPGMTVLTGETGAGKTLLVQALQLVLGGRAAPGLVRAGAPEALVEARFLLAGPPEAPRPDAQPSNARATRTGAGGRTGAASVPGDGPPAADEIVLARAVPASGRSRAWIDGRMVPVSALLEAGAALVDIHGQHDQQSLLVPGAQRAVLDQFAGADLGPLADARRALRAVVDQMDALGGDEGDRARRADLLRYQADEIARAGIGDPAEEDELAGEEERLADADALRTAAARAAAALDDGATGGATALLGAAVAALGGRDALGPWDRRLRDVLAEVADVATDLREAAETWEYDPARLDEVRSRRRRLADLRRKYGERLSDVVAFGDEARRALDDLEQQEELAARLERARTDAEQSVARAEDVLRQIRVAAAPGLAATATDRLRALAMPDARLEVAVDSGGAGDGVQLLLGANRGEPLQPLARVASGGELARAMLALRLVVDGGAPTMLFDEVDAGVGGAGALALARALRAVAATRQVLVVTHLPQVAAFADHQVAVRKGVDADGRTVTAAERLDNRGRVVELSRMLSGHPDSSTARAHAEELLAAAGASPAHRSATD